MDNENKTLTLPDNLPVEIKQSVIYTYRKSANLSVYEQRIILQALAAVQSILYPQDTRLSSKFSTEIKDLPKSIEFKMRFRDLEKDTSTYDRIKEASLSLLKRVFEFKDSQTHTWWATTFIISPEFHTDGTLMFEINKKFLAALLDLSEGFSRYDFNTAMRLPNNASLRFFELCSNQKDGYKITLTIEQWRKMLGYEGMYKNNSDFIARVFESSKKILDSFSPYTFVYKTERASRPCCKGRASITSITITPVRQPQFENPETLAARAKGQLSVGLLTDNGFRQKLMSITDMSNTELSRNKRTIEKFYKCPGMLNELSHIAAKGRNENWGKGQYINALKIFIEQCEQT